MLKPRVRSSAPTIHTMRTTLLVTAAALLLTAACGDTQADATAQAERRACHQLQRIANDWTDGIIGPADLTDRLPNVVQQARGTTLHQPARDALAAAQTGDPDALGTALTALNNQCP